MMHWAALGLSGGLVTPAHWLTKSLLSALVAKGGSKSLPVQYDPSQAADGSISVSAGCRNCLDDSCFK